MRRVGSSGSRPAPGAGDAVPGRASPPVGSRRWCRAGPSRGVAGGRRRAAGSGPRRGVLAGALALALVAGAGCSARVGMSMRRKARIDALEARVARLPPARALAIAGDPEGLFVAGYASGRSTVAEAVAAALARCEERRADRRVAAPCVVRRAVGRAADGGGE